MISGAAYRDLWPYAQLSITSFHHYNRTAISLFMGEYSALRARHTLQGGHVANQG